MLLEQFLQTVDLESLARKGTDVEVIPLEVAESFEVLDPTLPCPLKIRYLLLQTYKRLEQRYAKLLANYTELDAAQLALLEKHAELHDRWLAVLANHGVSSNVLDMVRQRYAVEYGMSVVPQHELGREVQNQPKTAGSEGYTLVEKHISVLTEILVGCSGKWHEIGTFLDLPQHILSDINRIYRLDSGIICFSKMLSAWIVGEHEKIKPPTLENLIAALRSRMVDHGCKARLLEREHLDKHLQDTSQSVSIQKYSPVHQPCHMKVHETSSTLLEAQAFDTHETPMFYHWMKDGCRLMDCKFYVGTNMQILCINATLASQGTYVCELVFETKSGGTRVLCSNPIALTVIVSPATRAVVDFYSFQPEVHEDSWPQANSNVFINLALIKRKRIEATKEFTCSTIQGDVDDFLTDKGIIEYEKAFGEYKSGNFVLVEGRPGSGKTTLVKKVSKDWANGKPILIGAKLVLRIPLRFLSPDDKLMDILKQLFYHDGEEFAVYENIKATNGEGVCFILDGLDEYASEDKDKSLIFQIIYRKYLQRSMVIVSSRPIANFKLRKTADTCIEVVGFRKPQIMEYLDNYTFSAASASTELKSYLANHVSIMRMCYLPVHAAMVCFLHNVMGENLPQTETGIYTYFTILTFLRVLKHQNEDFEIESIDDLAGENQAFFHELCRLAFIMTTSERQTFKKNELPVLEAALSDKPLLGFVSVDHTAGLYGLKKKFTFVHQSFQEYLTAYHISKLKKEEQIDVMNRYSSDKRMQMVWKFYCGLVNFREQEDNFRNIIKLYTNYPFLCQCAFESQQPSICKCLVLSGSGDLIFRDRILNFQDFIALSYVMSNASFCVKKLDIVDCNIGDSIKYLGDSLSLCINLESLDLSGNHLDDYCVPILCCSLKKLRILQELDLSKNVFSDRGTVALLSSLKSEELKSFNLQHNLLSRLCMDSLCTTLQQQTYLQVLSLSLVQFTSNDIRTLLKHCYLLKGLSLDGSHLHDDGVIAVSACLSDLKNLQMLNLSHNYIEDNGVKALAKNLHLSSLQILDLSDNFICDEGAEALICLMQCRNLKKLEISGNCIREGGITCLFKHLSLEVVHFSRNKYFSEGELGGDCARVLSDNLKQCLNLENLDLSGIGISDNSAGIIAVGLQHCCSLKTLHFSRNFIGDDGVKLLAESMKSFYNLQSLHLDQNLIGDDGMKALAKNVKFFHNLQSLHLDRNLIGDEGAKAIMEVMKNWKNLRTLNLDCNVIGKDIANELVKHCTGVHVFSFEGNLVHNPEIPQQLQKELAWTEKLYSL